MYLSYAQLSTKIDFSATEGHITKQMSMLNFEDVVIPKQYTFRKSSIRIYEAEFDDSLFDPFNIPTESFEYLNLESSLAQAGTVDIRSTQV